MRVRIAALSVGTIRFSWKIHAGLAISITEVQTNGLLHFAMFMRDSQGKVVRKVRN